MGRPGQTQALPHTPHPHPEPVVRTGESSPSANRGTNDTRAVSTTTEIPEREETPNSPWLTPPELAFDRPAQAHQIAQRDSESSHTCHEFQAVGPQIGILGHHHHLVEERRDRFGQATHDGSKSGH